MYISIKNIYIYSAIICLFQHPHYMLKAHKVSFHSGDMNGNVVLIYNNSQSQWEIQRANNRIGYYLLGLLIPYVKRHKPCILISGSRS